LPDKFRLALRIWFFHFWAKAVCALFFRVVLRKGFESQQIHEQPLRPRLYTLNHTNSFLDPVLFAVQRRQPLYFLARGENRLPTDRKTLTVKTTPQSISAVSIPLVLNQKPD